MKKLKNILTAFIFVIGFSFAIVNAQYDSNGIYIGNGSETYIPYNPYTGGGTNTYTPNTPSGGQICPAVFPSPYSCGSANYYCASLGGYVTRGQCPTTSPVSNTCIPPATQIYYFADPGPDAPRCACPSGSNIGYNQRCPDQNPTTCVTYADDLIHTQECRSTCPTGYYISGSKCYHLICPSGTERRYSDQFCITSDNEPTQPISRTCINYADNLVHTKECRFDCPNTYDYYKQNNTCYRYSCPDSTTRRYSDNYCITDTIRPSNRCNYTGWKWFIFGCNRSTYYYQ